MRTSGTRNHRHETARRHRALRTETAVVANYIRELSGHGAGRHPMVRPAPAGGRARPRGD